MNDLIDDTKMTGSIQQTGKDIYGNNTNVDNLRKNRDGFPKAKFPKNYFENVAYGLRVNGITDKMK
jgi:phosphate transport system ATP-binding protein